MNNPREQAFSARSLLVPPSLERCGLGEYLPSTRRTCPALLCPRPIRLRLSPRILSARLRFLTVFYVMSKHRTATQSKPTFPFAVRFHSFGNESRRGPPALSCTVLQFRFSRFAFIYLELFFFFFFMARGKKTILFFRSNRIGFSHPPAASAASVGSSARPL